MSLVFDCVGPWADYRRGMRWAVLRGRHAVSRRRRMAQAGLGAVGIVALVAAPVAGTPDGWTSVGRGSSAGVSGIAPAGSGWVIVHDNKKAAQDRVALLDGNAEVTPLAWPGAPPRDLEALDTVPGTQDRYVVVSSSGSGWVVRLGRSAVVIHRGFRIPGDVTQIEGFALTALGSSIVAAWAGRGSTNTPAQVRAAVFDPDAAAFGPVFAAGQVRVPYPTTDVRQVSDLKIVHGRVLVSATSDPGNRGPFTSAVYDVGSLDATGTGGRPQLTLTTPVELGRYDGHKVEGMACTDGVGVLGADDEKLGGAVTRAAFCPMP